MAEKDITKDGANEENTVAKDIVVTKYKMAAEIVNGTASTQVFYRCYFYVTGHTVVVNWKSEHAV